jgi:hypothetical protein
MKFHPNKLLTNFLLLINVHPGHLISMNIEELCAYIVVHRSDKVTPIPMNFALRMYRNTLFFMVANGTEVEAFVERYFFFAATDAAGSVTHAIATYIFVIIALSANTSS